MKKLLLMAAVAGFALASCTSEDETYGAQNNQEAEISFAAPVMYKTTRAVDPTTGYGEIEGKKYPENLQFNVWGIKYEGNYTSWTATGTSNAFMNNGDEKGADLQGKGAIPGLGQNKSITVKPKKFNNNVIGWFPDKKETFEQGKKYAFAAFSPDKINDVVAYGNNGLTITDYVVPALGQQYDIMYSARHYNIDKNSNVTSNTNGNDYYNGVNIVFKHAMSAVHFKTCVDPDYLRAMNAAGYDASKIEFRIKKISIKGIYNKGSFAENINLTDDKNALYSSDAAWTINKTGYNKEDLLTFFECSAEELALGGALVPKPAAIDTATLAYSLKDINDKGVFAKALHAHSGILMPQIFGATTGQTNDNAVIVIEWSMTDENGDSQDYKNTININKWTDVWEPAKRYNYNIVFKENLIYFAPQVVDWENQNIEINPDLTPIS